MTALRWMMLFMPIIVLFYHENGLSQKDVMVLQALFSVAIVIFEIPSGYFSDVIGRKITIIIGTFFGLIGFSVYALSHGFWGFLVAELLLGLGSSFISGTDSALIYDSLIDMGKEQNYVKFESKKTMIGNFSEATASILGGFLATISLRTPFYCVLVFYVLAFLLSFTLVEPHRHKMDTSKGQIHNILKIVKFSLYEQKRIRWFIIYSAVVGSSTLTMVWFIQPYLELVKLPLQYFGIAWAALNYSVGVFTYFAHHVEHALGRRMTLISLIFLTGLGYFLMATFFTLWAALFIFIFYYIRGINSPLLKNYINQLITSDMRATVLSVQGMTGRLTFSLIGPFIGWARDYYTMATAFLIAGIIFVSLGFVSIFFLGKNRAI